MRGDLKQGMTLGGARTRSRRIDRESSCGARVSVTETSGDELSAQGTA